MGCTAILVNYHGAALIAEAARSLVDDPACTHIHVLDNSACETEAGLLRQLLPTTVELTICPKNLGFAGACNLAFAQNDSDFVLLLNPDARLLPGALQKLIDCMVARPMAAAVGPRVYWDVDRQFLLPPSTYPSRLGFLLDRLGECWPALTHYRARSFRARALREWRAILPFQVDALSGGHVLLRRSALLAVGGLFDPRFFMYWEDSDLMRRLQDYGFTLWLEPAAEAIHLYEHSPDKDRLIADGWPAFSEKYFATAGWRWLSRFAQRHGRPVPHTKFQEIADTCDTGFTGESVTLAVPEAWQADWLLEFSPGSSFVPAMGHFGQGAVARLPLALARRFSEMPGFIRLGPGNTGIADNAQYFILRPAYHNSPA